MFGIMEALLSFIRRQVGLRTDAASATGSLHAKLEYLMDTIASGVVPGEMAASANLKYSDDTEVIYSVRSYEICRAIRVFRNGSVRVAFDAKRGTSGYGGVEARIYIDGVAKGTERSVSSSYTTYTEDFIVGANSTIEIWGQNDGTTGPYNTLDVRNFRLYFDVLTTPSVGAAKVR